jgi:hypothetical protein
MEFFNLSGDWIKWALGGAFSYLFYQQRKVDSRLDSLEKEYHRLDRSQVEIAVQIREIKEDIGYIRKGMDKIIERL